MFKLSDMRPSRNLPNSNDGQVKVLHFVSGGFSGATQVAIDLVSASLSDSGLEPLLVLRKKRNTSADKIAQLREKKIPVAVVSGWLHAVTVWQLYRLCKKFQPDVVFAHGFSEHLDGRYAALLARVPRIIHVEHNSRERYTWWRLWQARWLAKRTHAIVGCSEGVATRLHELGFPGDRIVAIPNGISLERFSGIPCPPLVERECAVVMSARFSRQKDHATLIRAVGLLKKQGGPSIKVHLAGGGKERWRKRAESLAQDCGVADQIHFLGHCNDLPALLTKCAVFVLSTHYEGMPLALLEGMAAGCVAIGSEVTGVKEIIRHAENGYLFPASDPTQLAALLINVIGDLPSHQAMANKAAFDIGKKYSLAHMVKEYLKFNPSKYNTDTEASHHQQ